MSINLGDIAATTLRRRNKELADNITNHNAFLHCLEKKGHIKNADGGRTLVEPLMYAENSNAKFYDGYETFTVTGPDDSIDAAEYDWKQLGGFATISGIEEIKNSGKHAALNLMESRIKVLEATLKNAAATSVYSDGTGTSGREFGGLQLLVADDPTASATVGGIAQDAQAFWRNQIDDQSAGVVTTTSNIKQYMNSMWLSTVRGTDKTDLILADSFMYSTYEESLQQYQRFATADTAGAGFESLKYKSAEVIYDDQCPTDHMYFLNTDHLFMQAAKSRKFTVGKARQIQNADYTIIPVWLAGNLTCSNRSLQGLFIGRQS